MGVGLWGRNGRHTSDRSALGLGSKQRTLVGVPSTQRANKITRTRVEKAHNMAVTGSSTHIRVWEPRNALHTRSCQPVQLCGFAPLQIPNEDAARYIGHGRAHIVIVDIHAERVTLAGRRGHDGAGGPWGVTVACCGATRRSCGTCGSRAAT